MINIHPNDAYDCPWVWNEANLLAVPIECMYGIFAYIYHEHRPNVGKYTSPMDPIGHWTQTILGGEGYVRTG